MSPGPWEQPPHLSSGSHDNVSWPEDHESSEQAEDEAMGPNALVRVLKAAVALLLILALLAYFVLPSRTFTSIRERLHIPSRIRPIPLMPKHNPQLVSWCFGPDVKPGGSTA